MAHACPAPPQIEAETYFVRARLLHPIYYPRYWISLQSTATSWPTFKWMDGYTPGPDGYTGAYVNWGVSADGTNQPDNRTHLCGVGDYLLAKNITANLTMQWGWNDVPCTATYASMCWQPPGKQAASPPSSQRRLASQAGYHLPRQDPRGLLCSSRLPGSQQAGRSGWRPSTTPLLPSPRSAQHLGVHQQQHQGHLLLEHHQEQLHQRRGILQGQGSPAGGLAVCSRAGAARAASRMGLLQAVSAVVVVGGSVADRNTPTACCCCSERGGVVVHGKVQHAAVLSQPILDWRQRRLWCAVDRARQRNPAHTNRAAAPVGLGIGGSQPL